jgi:hypothetical protein
VKDLFLCHTGADKAWVRELAKRLEAERIGGRAIDVFFDEWDIDGGENILAKIEEGLRASRFVAVVLTPAMTRADWPTMEWQTQVHQDPSGRNARILPLLLKTYDPDTSLPIDIPLPLTILKRYDFSSPKRFDSEFGQLLRRLRGEKSDRGRSSLGKSSTSESQYVGQDEPTGAAETILSNLLPVIRMPEFIYGDESSLTDRSSVIAKTNPNSPFVIDGGRLFSFWSPEDRQNPFRSVLTSRFRQKQQTISWLHDPNKSVRLVQMLNNALAEHCYALRIRRTDQAKGSFFVPVWEGKIRRFTWGSGRSRTLGKLVPTKTGGTFGVHQAAHLRFITLGSDLYLLVRPGWYFTEDGFKPVSGKTMGMLSMRWGGRERNAAVLRNVLMWGLLLGNGDSKIRLQLGSSEAELGCVPSSASVAVGVDSDEVRLDRLLSGGVAGEVADDELDSVAALAEEGEVSEVGELLDESDGDEDPL